MSNIGRRNVGIRECCFESICLGSDEFSNKSPIRIEYVPPWSNGTRTSHLGLLAKEVSVYEY